jgi:hydroxyquinol 1,2-dioxygenase
VQFSFGFVQAGNARPSLAFSQQDRRKVGLGESAMTKFNDQDLTSEVLRSFEGTPDARLKFLLQETVRALHDLVRRTGLTFEEWTRAIDFLTRTGQTCTPVRQEFILLSDVLGVSMLVDAVNHRERDGATETTVLGPFYVGEHRLTQHGTDIAEGVEGEPMFVQIRVVNVAGKPLAGAEIDVWHADDDGFYDTQKPGYEQRGPSLRARFAADADGRFSFRTILPCSYPIPTDGPVGDLIAAANRHPMRPAHVHFLVKAGGHEPLVTHVFIAGDRYLASDAVFGVKDELVAQVERRTESVMPNGDPVSGPWHLMTYEFQMKPGTGVAPRQMMAAE